MWSELTGSESGTLTRLRRATTPSEAARIFSTSFERPGIPDLANRERYANEAAGLSPVAGVAGSANAGGASSSSTLANTPEGLAGLAIKATLYASLLGGGAAMVWLGTKTALEPRKAANA